MIYFTIYLIGFIITFILMAKIDHQLDEDYDLYLIVSGLWPVVVPAKLGFTIYYFIRDKIKEYKTREPYVDPWEEAVIDYRDRTIDEISQIRQDKDRKNSKPFKFGR